MHAVVIQMTFLRSIEQVTYVQWLNPMSSMLRCNCVQ